jgi:hypothetical protein
LLFRVEAQSLLSQVLQGLFQEIGGAMNWKRDASKSSSSTDSSKSNLSFAGNGKVSVSVESIVKSERVQQQVKAVREIANSQNHAKK